MKVDYQVVEHIMSEVTTQVHRFPGTTCTVAAVFRKDGFMLATGVSGCVDPAEFDAKIGEEIALRNAMTNAENEVWRIEGVLLKEYMNKLAGTDTADGQ